MEYLLSNEQMKDCDEYTIHTLQISSPVLMERAALGVVEEVEKIERIKEQRILVACGIGNNAGDGLAIARILYRKGYDITVWYLDPFRKGTKEYEEQKEILKKYSVPNSSKPQVGEYNVIIDAIFGVGLTRNLEGNYRDAVEEINRSKAIKIAVDIPSGICGNTGKVKGIAVCADKTVSFAFFKIGTVMYPGVAYAGELVLKDIGIDMPPFWKNEKKELTFTFTRSDLRALPKRRAYSNKGSYGKVLVIAGSKEMGGAAYLSGKAAYRMGAGLVRIYTPLENRVSLQSLLPEAIVTTYETKNFPSKEEETQLKEAIQWADVLVVGPGMGKASYVKDMLDIVLMEVKKPIILDADALNVLAVEQSLKDKLRPNMILTPHIVEMSRLLQEPKEWIVDNLMESIKGLVTKYPVICVLKDARTLVTQKNKDLYINTSGNNGMATGGSGDVLTGVLAGLLGQVVNKNQSFTMEDIALGVYLHGLAGESAAKNVGEYSLLAGDITDGLIDVLQDEKCERK